jgi:hypothetical protein
MISVDVVVLMSRPVFPSPDVLLSRLVRSQDEDLLCDVDRTSVEELVDLLANRLGVQRLDLFLVAGLAVPDGDVPFDGIGSGALPRLVSRALRLPGSARGRLREFAQSLPVVSTSAIPQWDVLPSGERYPPGFGSLLVRMLALRNMGWSAAAHVLREMSGVYLSAATIGAIGRGVRGFDPEIIAGIAVVLGTPVNVLATLMDVDVAIGDHVHSPEKSDVAGLLWDVRQLTEIQVREVLDLADRLAD